MGLTNSAILVPNVVGRAISSLGNNISAETAVIRQASEGKVHVGVTKKIATSRSVYEVGVSLCDSRCANGKTGGSGAMTGSTAPTATPEKSLNAPSRSARTNQLETKAVDELLPVLTPESPAAPRGTPLASTRMSKTLTARYLQGNWYQ